MMSDPGDERYRRLAEREIIHVRRRYVSFALLGLGWAAFGMFFIVNCFPYVLTWARSVSWQVVPCRVVSASAAPSPSGANGDDYRINVEYVYKFAGRAFTGKRWHAGQQFVTLSAGAPTGDQLSPITSRLRKAKVCFVNPDKPTEAMLEDPFPLREAVICAFATVVSVLPGLAGFVWGLKSR